MLQDLRYALRQGARQPGLSLVIILTLGLGVGAATTAFSILHTVALQPPSFRDVDRLAAIYAHSRGDGQGRSAAPYDVVRELPSTGLFDAVVAYSPRGFNARAPLAVERVSGAQISGDLFALLGATLVAGRPFSAEEHTEGADVVVLGHAFWTRAYQADTSALGTTIHLDGRPYAVVGVAPQGFGFPGASDVWMPLPPAAVDLRVWAVARLRNEMTVEQADAVVAGRPPAGMADPVETVVRVTSLHESLISGKHQAAATALLTASGLVLLIACVNLAGLILARMSSRRQELALRSAVGAGRPHIIRLLMTESLVLSAAGGALGILLAQWGVDLFVGVLGAPSGAAWMEFGVNSRALLFAMGLSVLTAVVFGLAPAVRASRVEIREVLMEGSGQTADRRGGRRQRVLVVAQIAVSLALVAASASVVASSIGLERVPAGFDPAGLLAARVNLSDARYDMPAARLAFMERVCSRLEALPGVTGVTVASHLPLMDRNPRAARFLVDAALPAESQPIASLRFVAADYPETLRIPTVRGRSFTDVEARDADGRTALINESMARRYWSGGEAVGRTMTLAGGASGDLDLTIVGVVGDVAQRQLPGQGENQVYLPLAQARELSLVVRTTADPARLARMCGRRCSRRTRPCRCRCKRWRMRTAGTCGIAGGKGWCSPRLGGSPCCWRRSASTASCR